MINLIPLEYAIYDLQDKCIIDYADSLAEAQAIIEEMPSGYEIRKRIDAAHHEDIRYEKISC